MTMAEHTLAPGAQIDDYLVEEAAAEGGFAHVYRCTHLPSGRVAAVKLLHRLFATSAKTLRRFQREVELVDRLRHRNIVHFYGFGEHSDGRPYLAMEWLAGRTLTQEIAHRGRFAPADAVRAICDLCAPLALTHELGVVHRDLKGSNVMAVPEADWFRLTLLDFGIAKLVDPDVGDMATTVGVRVGSPHAMAPEQVLGAQVDGRTDIYGLGVLLYHLLTGELPFRGATAEEVEELHLSAKPVRPRKKADMPKALDTLVMACLAKDPHKRPRDVTALAAALSASVG